VRVQLDTNILLRIAVQTDPERPRVQAALDRLLDDDWELCIGVQNVVEFWVVATRPLNVNGLGLSPEQAQKEVATLLATYTLLRDPADLFERWLELCSRYGVSGRQAHDARLVALALWSGVRHLFTLNVRDFARYAEIIVLTPEDV